MQTTNVEQEVRTFLVDNFLMGQADALKADEPLMGNVIDSTGVLELVVFLQDRFLITVEDDEVTTANLDSLKNVVMFVEQKVASKAKV